MSSHNPARTVSERFSAEAKTYRNYIAGRFTEPSVSQIDVLNPATGALVGRVPESTAQEVDEAVRAAKVAQPSWEQLPAIERAGHLRAISAKLRQHRIELAVETLDPSHLAPIRHRRARAEGDAPPAEFSPEEYRGSRGER